MSSLTVQRKAHHTSRAASVARQLPVSVKAEASSDTRRRRTSVTSHPAAGAELDEKQEERRREIASILKLKDQKEQVIRFLKLISYETGESSSLSKVCNCFSMFVVKVLLVLIKSCI